MPPAEPVPGPRPLDLLVDVLASYRLTRLITTDEITRPYRDKIITAAREKKQQDPAPDPHAPPAYRSLAYLVTCDYCTSVYTSAALALLRAASASASAPTDGRSGAMLRTARYALATAGAVSLLREALDR